MPCFVSFVGRGLLQVSDANPLTEVSGFASLTVCTWNRNSLSNIVIKLRGTRHFIHFDPNLIQNKTEKRWYSKFLLQILEGGLHLQSRERVE